MEDSMPDTRQAVVDLIFGRWRSQILHAGVYPASRLMGVVEGVKG